MTSNMGRPGTGANSITGQCNAMGSRIFSNTTYLIGGHNFANPAHRQKVADFFGIDVRRIQDKPGWAYDQILKGIEKDVIKGLWIVCTNPVHSWINKNWLFKILDKLEYLVVQDMYHSTETAQLADLILAAAGCGEKEGTFINSERRLGVIRKIMDPSGSALPDFEIFRKIGEYWGCSELFKEWTSPAAAFEILKSLSKGQPCDMSGITDYSDVEQQGGVQWPYPAGGEDRKQERRLFEDGKYYHADGKARFFYQDIDPVPEATSEEYPFVLLTGRGTVAQWHTQTRTSKVEMLRKMYPQEVYVEIHPVDAAKHGIKEGDRVIVSSKRSEIMAKAAVRASVKPGELFMAMHYFETNKLTYAAFDPHSREPSYKYAATKIKREDEGLDSYVCTICDYVYDPAIGAPDYGIESGTRFENLPDDWICPVCGVKKDLFKKHEAGNCTDLNQELVIVGHPFERINEGAEKTFDEILDEIIGDDPDGPDSSIYKDRFENLSRVARRITSSLNIGTTLEMIRDEVRATIPHAQEACLLMFDPEAPRYTRPLHCAMYKERISCQLCKRGREIIESALKNPLTLQCSADPEFGKAVSSHGSDKSICEIAFPINDGQKPLAVLDVIAKEGHSLGERDIILVKDLANLAKNLIINARSHWKIAQEKLTLESILGHLRPFVPETVQRIVEKDPTAPSLSKRKIDVSTLFLDIAGYTRISESFTQEMVNFIIEKYFSSFLDAIYDHGGDINETAGDGLMAIFQGDVRENALNAAHASLDIRLRTMEINKELEGRFEAIDINMGINSGIAFVGMTQFHGKAGIRVTFTASGPATNLAARLASAATGGDILVGPKTASRIKKKIELYDRGFMDFKDMKEKVRVFSLIRP